MFFVVNVLGYFKIAYRKVASNSLSRLVAHFQIFRRLMKGKFDAYVLWPLAKKFQNWIVDRSTARDFTVYEIMNKNILYINSSNSRSTTEVTLTYDLDFEIDCKNPWAISIFSNCHERIRGSHLKFKKYILFCIFLME